MGCRGSDIMKNCTGSQPMGSPRSKWEEGIKKMLPDFSNVTTGN
jgi:hypothetical protein